MLEPDFTEPVPTVAAQVRAWRDADFPLNTRTYPSLEKFVEALRPRYANGAVLSASFRWPGEPTFDWYLSRNRAEELLFFHKFWHAPTPAAALRELRVPADYAGRPPFQWASSFSLAGELALALYNGGAYHRPAGTGADEMRLAGQVTLELFGGRYSEVLTFVNHGAWTPFFHDVAWDFTWLLLDKRERLVHVLCATDTD